MRAFASLILILTAGVTGAAPSPSRAQDAQMSFGRHLAQECTGCHASTQPGAAIPAIAGLNVPTFTARIKAYQSGRLADGKAANPAMVSVAQSLGDKEIAALAHYFAALPPPQPHARP
jgi:cytochrome c553